MMTQSSTAMRWCNASLCRGLKPALLMGFLLLGLSVPGQAAPRRVPIPEPKPKPAIRTPGALWAASNSMRATPSKSSSTTPLPTPRSA